ncbi:EscU/YscU/HrcU family type III secretion system export apparatus switch protein, partial [Cryobacterium roopkundense]|uniref:EscU/YscU/HrcU family type III secretion system export apparatus switch protein n=1 Tax=Cryobacterium roopkundense TaxID=1001240 RepID=UPI003083FB91
PPASASRPNRPGPHSCRTIPLARALHGACEIGEEIPVDRYNSVARVLAFVMALKGRGGGGGGVHTMTPQPAQNPSFATTTGGN